jgi:hypothetical protein
MNDSRNVPLMGNLNTVVWMDKVISYISGSCNFITFLYFIHLWWKINSLQRYDIAQNHRILHRVVQRLSQHNLKFSHHRHIWKTASNKIMIQIKLTCPWSLAIPKFICPSATVNELSPQNKIWILTFKQLPCSYFLFLTKMGSLKVVHRLKICQYTKFHGASFASTSQVWTSAILEWLKIRD